MERDWYAVGWKMLLFRGVLGILFGILAIAWPIETAIAFALLWGIWALADGVGSIVQAFQPDAKGRVWLVLMGLIALIAAFFAIFSPGVAAVTLTWILGIWLIVRGVFEIVGAFTSSRRHVALAAGGRRRTLGGARHPVRGQPRQGRREHRLRAGPDGAAVGYRVRRAQPDAAQPGEPRRRSRDDSPATA